MTSLIYSEAIKPRITANSSCFSILYNIKDKREKDEIALIDPDRNMGQMLINNHAPACADGLVLSSIGALYYLRCDSRAAYLLARPFTAMLSTTRTSG